MNDPQDKKEEKKRQRPADTEAKKGDKTAKKSKNVPVNCK